MALPTKLLTELLFGPRRHLINTMKHVVDSDIKQNTAQISLVVASVSRLLQHYICHNTAYILSHNTNGSKYKQGRNSKSENKLLRKGVHSMDVVVKISKANLFSSFPVIYHRHCFCQKQVSCSLHHKRTVKRVPHELTLPLKNQINKLARGRVKLAARH